MKYPSSKENSRKKKKKPKKLLNKIINHPRQTVEELQQGNPWLEPTNIFPASFFLHLRSQDVLHYELYFQSPY